LFLYVRVFGCFLLFQLSKTDSDVVPKTTEELSPSKDQEEEEKPTLVSSFPSDETDDRVSYFSFLVSVNSVIQKKTLCFTSGACRIQLKQMTLIETSKKYLHRQPKIHKYSTNMHR
jgi:hypothetical protein